MIRCISDDFLDEIDAEIMYRDDFEENFNDIEEDVDYDESFWGLL